jgi:hypothetical protein
MPPRHATTGPPPPRRRRSRGRSWLAWAFVVAAFALARDTAAELTVTAYGRQTLDLASGRTVLDDGGEVVDRRSGVRLVAAWVSYAEGVEVVAREASFEGELGRVTAPEATIDLLRGRVWAGGGVLWERDGLAVRGEELRFDAEAGIVGMLGGVVATAPDASAAEAWVEIVGGRILMLGPYRYADGPIVLSGEAGRALQLDLVVAADGLTYDARTDVEPAWRDAVEGLRHGGWSRSGD